MSDTALQNVVLQLTETADKLAALERLVATLGADIRQQADRTARLQVLEEALATLNARVAEVLPDEQGAARVYAPRPAPRWWNLSGEAREAEIGRLRGFVEHVYRPGFGTWRPGCGPAGSPTTYACTASTSPPSCMPSCTSNPVGPSPSSTAKPNTPPAYSQRWPT